MALSTQAPDGPAVAVGSLLRDWRQRRNLSQLELALDADVSSRHVSFLETGRSQPSRDMVLRLAERLEIPLRERNRLLLAAGYAPVYAQTPLQDDALAPVRQAIDRFLRAHEPYPALVVDDHHDLLNANDAVGTLTHGVAPELLTQSPNTLRITLHPDGMASQIVNFAEWSSRLMHHLAREVAASADPVLAALYEELAGYPGVALQADPSSPAEIIVPLRIIRDGRELAFFSTISTFGTARDITLDGLAIEAFYPADAATANHLLGTLG